MKKTKLSSCAIVFVTNDIEKTANYYRNVLGFRVVEHYDRKEKFAALYLDSVEIILVQAQFGSIQSNQVRYGAGFDAYLVPESPEAVEIFYDEIRTNGAKITQKPAMTTYGSLEFVFEDIEGRLIGVGCIKNEATFLGEIG
jgi:catechol 2,3-dioxygenase-like lactoylglutathione lyase family enzyme